VEATATGGFGQVHTQFIDDLETEIDAQNRFYAPVSYTDPYGSKTRVRYYRDYFLFIEETEDELKNKSRVDLFNFRTLFTPTHEGYQQTISPKQFLTNWAL
jgi:hypothetical protein